MLLIDCPYCGKRPEIEFHCGGEAHIARPLDPSQLDDAQWAEFLFYRANTKGVLAERWNHTHGCQRWFNALRNTVTDEILTTYKMGEPRPDMPTGAVSESDAEIAPQGSVPGETSPREPSP